jgi:hypothetical protein
VRPGDDFCGLSLRVLEHDIDALLGLLDHPSARFFQEREFVVGRVARNGAPDEGDVARVVECPSISLNLGMEFPDAGHDLVAET